MKTPEEVKKGLECCTTSLYGCMECPYNNDGCSDNEEMTDALALIEQLEEREWELFNLLSSAFYGQQCYFKQDDGTVYSRATCEYLSFDQAIDEFAEILSGEDKTHSGKDMNVPRWISVKERLPEMDTRVAVLYRFPRSETLFSSVLDYYAADPEPHFQHTLGEGGPIVCYWMPLPSAPEVWS